ncbi:MAG: hypothetical protein ACI9E1_002014 [Cryomorphaceae bacterium]|jgi:hypothetical protein
MKNCILPMLALFVALTFSNCGSVDPRNYGDSYSPRSSGGRVVLVNGRAVAPANAPIAVKRAVAAGNALQRKPYKMGGGHARQNDSGYDCSGTVSYVLRNAGLMNSTMPSKGFRSYGKRGKGRWITIYARSGHVFMTIGGLRLDARGSSRGYMGGPRWLAKPRSPKGFSVRHPVGL